MRLISKLNNLFCPPRLSRRRIVFAVMVAVVADGLQIPLQVPPLPQIIDVVAMVLTSSAIGFHLLLLPTFAVEFVPGIDMLPTWTGCVLAVIALRRLEAKAQPPVQAGQPPVILPPPPPPRLRPPPENGE